MDNSQCSSGIGSPPVSLPNVQSPVGSQHQQGSQQQSQSGGNDGGCIGGQQLASSQGSSNNKPTIERGASWSYNETRILLSLWGQDMVQRQLTNSKRTRHVWEKIAERIKEHGFDRTPDQVRTRVFNMIAEYRRILKNPTPERKKKCIFFDALHKIYQAKDASGVKAALNYDDDYVLEPLDLGPEEPNDGVGGGDGDGDGSGEEGEEMFSYSMSPPHTLNGVSNNKQGASFSNKEPTASSSAPSTSNNNAPNTTNNNNIDHDDASYDGEINREENNTGNPSKRLRSDSNPTNYYQHHPHFANNPSTTFELPTPPPTASALLIDRVFKHLTKETEVMREWINLEKERYEREAARQKEENEREERREKAFLDTLMRMQEQTFRLLSCFNPYDRGCHSRLAFNSMPSEQIYQESAPPPTSTTSLPQRNFSGSRTKQHMMC